MAIEAALTPTLKPSVLIEASIFLLNNSSLPSIRRMKTSPLSCKVSPTDTIALLIRSVNSVSCPGSNRSCASTPPTVTCSSIVSPVLFSRILKEPPRTKSPMPSRFTVAVASRAKVPAFVPAVQIPTASDRSVTCNCPPLPRSANPLIPTPPNII